MRGNILTFEELDGKMMTLQKKSIVIVRLSAYITQELQSREQFTEKSVCNKIDKFNEEREGCLREVQL